VAEYGEPLSERELEALKLVATGASNKEIAQQLHISVNTVKVHLRNIFAKLGAVSRTEATMIAVREGWVSLPAELVTTAVPAAEPAVEASPEPPLSWFRRAVLVAAALLAITALVLSWPRAAPAESPLVGVLPAGGGVSPNPIVRLGEESRWSERAQMPTRRAWLGLAAWGGRLYAIGGEGPGGSSDAVEVYDPSGDTWHRASARPTPAAYIAAAALSDRIIVPGGCTGEGTALDVVEVYDPATDGWASAASLPHPLCAYALATVGERLYLFGGTDGQEYLASTFVYDPQADRWERRAPMPQARALAAAAVLEGRVYVVGGYVAGQELTACAVYDPAADTWQECAPLTMARGGLGLVAIGGRLYAIGGGGWGGYLGFNEQYDPAAGRWTAVETPVMGSWQGAGVAVLDLTAYVIGGYGDDYLSLSLSFEPLPFRIFIPATER